MSDLISPEGERLAREALRRIDADPASFNQALWGRKHKCGTVACMGGHVIMAAGGEPTELEGEYVYADRQRHASDLARELLDISWEHADALFQSGNSRDDLGLIVDALVAGDVDALADYVPVEWDGYDPSEDEPW